MSNEKLNISENFIYHCKKLTLKELAYTELPEKIKIVNLEKKGREI